MTKSELLLEVGSFLWKKVIPFIPICPSLANLEFRRKILNFIDLIFFSKILLMIARIGCEIIG